MKVQIVSAERPTYWYADRIGRTVEVTEFQGTKGCNCSSCVQAREDDEDFEVVESDPIFAEEYVKDEEDNEAMVLCIAKVDCVIIEE